MNPFLTLLSVLVGLFRPVLLFTEFNSHIESSYQAVAHILVGVLLTAWLTGTRLGSLKPDESKSMLFKLTAIEVVCAAVAFLLK